MRKPAEQKPRTIEERLGIGEKSRFLVNGDAGDVIILYNALPSAPQVAKNIRGDFVFQSDAASLCFGHSAPDALLARFVEQRVTEQGAKKLSRQGQMCDLAKVASAIDLVVFQRGELLKQRDDYLLALVKLVEATSLRQFSIIPAAEVVATIQARQALSAQIESEIERGVRDGYGIITFVNSASPACLAMSPDPARNDGLKLMFSRQRELISPQITGDWKFVEASVDSAFIFVQRGQCGYVVADAATLQSYVKALRREQISYKFAPVWFDAQQVVATAAEVADEREMRIRRDAEREREKTDRAALEEKRRAEKESQKDERERKMRAEHGVKAKALLERIDKVAKDFAERTSGDAIEVFPGYSRWITQRAADQWETLEVKSDIADFGIAKWNGRPLEGIVVKSIVQQKNRILGQYSRDCFQFVLLDDAEFAMQREVRDGRCEEDAVLKKWKVENSFRTRWNAE